MRETLLARRYAKAAFDLAVEMDTMEQSKDDMALVLETAEQSKDLRLLMKSPVIRAEKKIAVLHEIFKDHIGELIIRFLDLIVKQRREPIFLEIARQFIVLYKERENITTTWLTTPVKISGEIRDKVVRLIEQHTQSTVELIEEIDEDLIGGFVLNFDDKQYDASLKRKINRLKKEFGQNPFAPGY